MPCRPSRVRTGKKRWIESEEEHMLAEVFCDHHETIDTG
jgi:hypothetical protein